MRIRVVVAALLVPIALATGCGDEGGGSATDPEPTAESSTAPTEPPSSSAPAEPTGPACEEVWVDGSTLPKDYAGCAEDDVTVRPDGLGCSSGQKIIRYADRFFAVPGGLIRETDGLNRDRDYLDAIASCRG